MRTLLCYEEASRYSIRDSSLGLYTIFELTSVWPVVEGCYAPWGPLLNANACGVE
jgi:hypothetical protein